MKFLTILSFIFIFSFITLAQNKPLQGKWSFISLKEKGENISLPQQSEDHYFTFAKNARFSSSITCNNIGGKYLLGTTGKIKFSSLLMTLKGCFGEQSKVEHSLSRVLTKVTKYQIKGHILTLQDAGGMNVVTLTKLNRPK